MQCFNDEGELLYDLSKDLNIPGRMCSRAVLVEKGKIYVVGEKQTKNEWIN